MVISGRDRRIIVKNPKKHNRSNSAVINTVVRLQQSLESPSTQKVNGDFLYIGHPGPYQDILNENLVGDKKLLAAPTWEMAKNLITNKKLSFVLFTMVLEDRNSLTQTLEEIAESINQGGTIFIPEFWNLPKVHVRRMALEKFMEDNKNFIVHSRQQTKPGIRDFYLVIKICRNPSYRKRTAPLTIAMVMRSGGTYTGEHVTKLANMIRRNLTVDHEMVCLTNRHGDAQIQKAVDRVIPLKHGLEGWWSKIELFRPELFEDRHVLYLDLDTIPTANIDYLADYGGTFLALRDFNTLNNMGSGIMSWNPKMVGDVFPALLRIAKGGNVRKYTGGDQELLEEVIGLENIEFFQDLFPGKIIEFKYKCIRENGSIINPEEVEEGIICFHGRPKMENLRNEPLIKEYWK